MPKQNFWDHFYESNIPQRVLGQVNNSKSDLADLYLRNIMIRAPGRANNAEFPSNSFPRQSFYIAR